MADTASRAVPGYHTTIELAERAGLTDHTIRWHCRQGALAGLAVYTQRAWLIPDKWAQWFLDRGET
jgi:hypothetical protein